jgi:Skp family chaperone for outer membrane proteins
MIRPMTTAMLSAVAMLAMLPIAAHSQDYFVPNQPRQTQPARRPAPPAQRPAASPQFAPPQDAGPGDPGPDTDTPPVQFAVPPVPELPALPKGAAPPVATMGVIDVPDVMRASTAAQQIDRVIGERRQKVSEDAQKEQASWRDIQQTLANQRSTMSPDQIRAKERELQERITSAQRQFRERNRVIQEAAQVSLNQIQAVLIGVIRQVAESRGMNLVLHRQQVALNVNEFDITAAVAAQLNRLLPSVTIPPDGVAPTAAIPVQLSPAATVPPASATPAATAPATPTPATPAPAASAPKK